MSEQTEEAGRKSIAWLFVAFSSQLSRKYTKSPALILINALLCVQ